MRGQDDWPDYTNGAFFAVQRTEEGRITVAFHHRFGLICHPDTDAALLLVVERGAGCLGFVAGKRNDVFAADPELRDDSFRFHLR